MRPLDVDVSYTVVILWMTLALVHCLLYPTFIICFCFSMFIPDVHYLSDY